MQEYLNATSFIDYNHRLVQQFVQENSESGTNIEQQAIQLYYAVRDLIRYDPYTYAYHPEGFKASTIIANGRGWCVPKAILYAACCRAIGVPAQLGYADVRNHLSTARMRASMQTDIFYWHGYTSIFLNDKWVKATPAFNKELCEKFGLKTLEFDGQEDSIYHPFDLSGQKHMEYLKDRGTYVDFPYELMARELKQLYPNFSPGNNTADFEKDVQDEVA